MIDFNGRTVYIAGGSSGINLSIGEAFAKQGARVALISRSQNKVDAAVASLKRWGNEVIGFSADVRDYAAVELSLQKTQGVFGDLDIVISGAAGNFPAAAAEMSANAFRSVVEIDLLGTYHVLRAAYPFLKKPGASIINISAPQAFVPMPLQSHVCAAKSGVDMLTRTLALEWGPIGIRVNSIVPGPIEGTEGMQRLAPTEEIREQIRQSVPLARMGKLDDIANAALLLSSPLASFISGAVIPVDGGWSLGGAGDVMRRVADVLKAMGKQQR